MSLEYAHRFPRLHQKRLIVLQALETLDDGMITFPVSGGLSRAAVDDQFLWFLRDLLIQIVVQHTQGRLLLPSLAGNVIASGRFYWSVFHFKTSSFLETTSIEG